MTLMNSKFRYLLPCALGVLVAGCAPMTVPPKAEYPAGRARLVLPAGAWQDLGISDQTRAGLQTRSVGLRGAQGEWLAVLRVQTNRTGALAGFPLSADDCPRQENVFVTDPAVPPTNNAAERSLLPLVVSRKISGGTRSARGTRTKMTLASLFGTWRAQDRNPFDECRTLLSSPQL